MKIIHSDFKKGNVKVQISSFDDLWFLSTVIEQGDIVSGSTYRKIKLGGEGENTRVVKKPVRLSLEIEEVEFHKYSDSLRVGGIIREGPDDVPHGSHHTLDVKEGTIIEIKKEKWLNYQITKIKEAAEQKGSKILICVLDRESACFAIMKKYGFDYLGELEGNVQKKRVEDKTVKEGQFYAEIIKALEEYDKRYGLEHIIIASPAFWKEELLNNIKKKLPSIAKKVTTATCNSFGKNAINEVLKRTEVKEVLRDDRIANESKIVEELLKEISKDSLAAYSFDDTKKAAEAGAVSILLVTDKLIKESRLSNDFEKLEYVLNLVETSKGEIRLISTDHEAGMKLQGLGGIGAILRYKLEY